MPPRTEKRKSKQEENSFNLNDSINTDEWRCAVALLVEGTSEDEGLTRKFAEESSMNAREEVKCIDFNSHVIKILKEFISGEISYKYSFLLNFMEVLQEAAAYIKNSQSLPTAVTVNMIKAIVFMLRKEDIDRRKKLQECKNDPIEIMALKPVVPSWTNEYTEKENEKLDGKIQKKPTQVKNPSVSIRPLTVAKRDTKLLRRGESPKDFNTIDDKPDNSFFHFYIALTGFSDPDLAFEMLKRDIPLHSVICIHSSGAETDRTQYWNEFLQILWNPSLTHYFRDVVFLLYTPENLPFDEKELRSFICREICFLLYDLSDLKHQLMNYLRHMRLWKVDETGEKIEANPKELDQLPNECINIPIIMQYILDVICGEDGEDCGEDEHLEGKPSSILTTHTSEISRLKRNPEMRNSDTSLIPFFSTVKMQSPRWNSIVDTDEKYALYNKVLTLDNMYEIEDTIDSSEPERLIPCVLQKRRIPCENLDAEIQNYHVGILAKFWSNYPPQVNRDSYEMSDISANLSFPSLKANYMLYILWITRMEDRNNSKRERVSISDLSCNNSQIKFTVTDGSRIALQKTTRSRDFFSPSQLKLLPPQMLHSFSEPQLRSAAKFSWTEKSFVSDFHIPKKYINGTPMGVFDDLKSYLNEDALSRMKGYDFVEELNREEMIQRIESTSQLYDCVRHAYSPLTDSIYVVMYNTPTVNGIQRQVHNEMLTTPVGLRDFHDYILDDEREWLSTQILETQDTTNQKQCPISMYNPTPVFRDFPESYFWHEKSIKFMNHEGSDLDLTIPKIESGESVKGVAAEERSSFGQKLTSQVYADPGEPYRFIGFDFEPGALQFSEVQTTYKGPDNCTVRVCLQERLYGTQQLGVHIQQGGHNLHLYSFVCPQPHLDQPYTCHVAYNNGIIGAFSRCSSVVQITPESSVESLPLPFSMEENFAYDMKFSFPHGLAIETVRKFVSPCYIKQSYQQNDRKEKSRLFLPSGSIIKMLADSTVQILNPDTSIITASLADLVSETTNPESEFSDILEESSVNCFLFQSYTETMANGCQYKVVGENITESTRFQIIKNTDVESKRRFFRRMDSTNYVHWLDDGTTCVEFPDGSKICTYLEDEELYIDEECSWGGETIISDTFVTVDKKIVMEHPDYATVIYETRSHSWNIKLPEKSEIKIDSNGCYQLNIDEYTELDINRETIRMWRYNEHEELVTTTIADLTAFGREPSCKYCTTYDSYGRSFIIEAGGTCYVNDGDSETKSTSENQAEDTPELKRYFVVRRDLSGFEFIHTSNVKKDIIDVETDGSEVMVHCQELKTVPVTRYFSVLRSFEAQPFEKWKMHSITPSARYGNDIAKSSSTYGSPPSWMLPFPRVKQKAPLPQILKGRIVLELNPTDCPNPYISYKNYAFYDTNHFPEPKTSIIDDVPEIMRKVADQDQEILREMYFTALKNRVNANKMTRKGSSQLEKYLKMSENHVKLREYLKQSIRHKIIKGYFDHPSGMAWLIIQEVIESIIKENTKPKSQIVSSLTESTEESSELEYDLEWSTESNFSDISYHSGLSMKTAPPAMGQLPFSPHLYNPRETKSEPVYKMEDVKKSNDNQSYVYGYDFTTPASQVCVFQEGDILTLEQRSPHKVEEPEETMYDLDDLMNLGLV